jgi:hypothetical protein
MEKQTAVRWLIKEFRKNGIVIPMQMEQQAKEMEKEQRIADYYKGACDESYSHGAQSICESDAEKWYNETFGGNNE